MAFDAYSQGVDGGSDLTPVGARAILSTCQQRPRDGCTMSVMGASREVYVDKGPSFDCRLRCV
jgi:hypothetical protein